MKRQFDPTQLPALIEQAAQVMGCAVNDVEWYSWPESFPSTAGPHKGRIAGQAFTTFQVFGFKTWQSRKRLLYCDGLWKDWTSAVQAWQETE